MTKYNDSDSNLPPRSTKWCSEASQRAASLWLRKVHQKMFFSKFYGEIIKNGKVLMCIFQTRSEPPVSLASISSPGANEREPWKYPDIQISTGDAMLNSSVRSQNPLLSTSSEKQPFWLFSVWPECAVTDVFLQIAFQIIKLWRPRFGVSYH